MMHNISDNNNNNEKYQQRFYFNNNNIFIDGRMKEREREGQNNVTRPSTQN